MKETVKKNKLGNTAKKTGRGSFYKNRKKTLKNAERNNEKKKKETLKRKKGRKFFVKNRKKALKKRLRERCEKMRKKILL